MPFPSPSSIEKFEGWISTQALSKWININTSIIILKLKLSKELLPPLPLHFINVRQPKVDMGFYVI